MKTVFCRILKAPKAGDDLRICYVGVRGGRTEAAYIVNTNDLWRPQAEGDKGREVWVKQTDPGEPAVTYVKLTEREVIEAITKRMAETVTQRWDGDMFSAQPRRDEVVITCNDGSMKFEAMLNGTHAAGNEHIEIEQ